MEEERKNQEHGRSWLGAYAMIFGAFVLLLVIMSSLRGCGNSYPSIYYNGSRNQDFYILEGAECWNVDVLEPIGEVSKIQHIPTKQFASNQGTVGQPIYRVYIGEEEWLVIDIVKDTIGKTGIITLHSQIFFGEFETK